MKRLNVELGADIEWFPPQIATGEADAAFYKHYDRILASMGSKHRPHIAKGLGVYHNDCTSVEFATPVAQGYVDLIEKVHAMHTYLQAHLSLDLQGYDYVDFPRPNEAEAPYLFMEYTHLGCAKDMVDGEVRNLPLSVKTRSIKESGFHIHITLPESVQATFYTDRLPTGDDMLMEMDTYVKDFVKGLQEETAMFHTPDHPHHKLWYRAPGTYRIKPYGVEYRSIGAGIYQDLERTATWLSMVEEYTKDFWRTVA